MNQYLRTAWALVLMAALSISTAPAQTAGGSATNTKAEIDRLDMEIGQMVMIGIYGITQLDAGTSLYRELQEGTIGGIVLFEKNISKTNAQNNLKKLIADLQAASPQPLFISIDEEGGVVHRLKEKYGFVGMPSAAWLGAIDNADSTLYYNRRLAAQLANLGINLNYAPTVDVAVNPKNPVIVQNDRSFSSDPAVVTRHALLCIQAHRENGVKTILKHFPGHGSSTTDSHLGIVDVTDSWSYDELVPFYNIIQSGHCDAVMTAHIINQHWDKSALPATLSPKVVNGMLRSMLGFKGVVFSDDMQMHAISKNYGFENAIKMSIDAGVDVLMFANNVLPRDRVTASEVHAIIKKLVLQGDISRERISESYRRIQLLKRK